MGIYRCSRDVWDMSNTALWKGNSHYLRHWEYYWRSVINYINSPLQSQKRCPSTEMENPPVPSKSDQKALPGHLHFCKVKTNQKKKKKDNKTHRDIISWAGFKKLLEIAFNWSMHLETVYSPQACNHRCECWDHNTKCISYLLSEVTCLSLGLSNTFQLLWGGEKIWHTLIKWLKLYLLFTNHKICCIWSMKEYVYFTVYFKHQAKAPRTHNGGSCFVMQWSLN